MKLRKQLKQYALIIIVGLPLPMFQSCDSESEINPEIIELEWSMVGNLIKGRQEDQIVYLNQNEVMIIGGVSRDNFVELFNLNDYSSKQLSPLNIGRESHRAIKIGDNNVMVMGGLTGDKERFSRTCEIYDYETNSWSLTAEMNVGRSSMGAIMLPNGKIMVFGGFGERENSSWGQPLADVEVFDPIENKWSLVEPMKTPKNISGAYLINDHEVLVYNQREYEVYDYQLDDWTIHGEWPKSYLGIRSVQLEDENVLFATEDFATIFNSKTKEWIPISPMNTERYEHTLTSIGDGLVLAIGGSRPLTPEERDNFSPFLNTTETSTCEVYDVAKDQWIMTTGLHLSRSKHKSILVENQKVLVIGGWGQARGTEIEISNSLK